MKSDISSNVARRVFVTLVTIVFVLSLAQAQENAPVLRIGVLDSPDGPIARGAELAVWQINETGGIQSADGRRIRLELVVEATVPGEDLTNAINSLSGTNIIAVLGPQTTEEILSNMALLQNLNVPILTPAVGDTVVASDPTGMVFRIRAAERLQGATLADVLVNDLGVQRITTVQLDSASTGGRVGLSVALGGLDPAPQETALVLQSGQTVDDLVAEIMRGNPSVLAVFGPPDIASDLYSKLRAGGWMGTFAYNHADDGAFRGAVDRSELNGILGTTTWPLSAMDDQSNAFLNSYVHAFGAVPGPIEAAAYDAVNLLAAAIRQPGPLAANFAANRDVLGVQGVLNPSGLAAGETSNSVAVIRLNAFGGIDTVARYAGSARLPEDGRIPVVDLTATPQGTPTPSPTATPEGVVLTILSAVQNVRTGPGLEYDVLGQLRQGEQVPIIGATVDFSWVVIQFRGQQGWLATYLLDVFGDRSTVPVLAIPPTPTPRPPTPTPLPSPLPPIPDIRIMAAMPTNITLGQATNIMVTVTNAGGAAAGPFAVAATFPPDNAYAAANLAGLATGAQQIVALPVTLSAQSGNFNVTIVADLNNQVAESPEGEANNDDYVFSFHLDRQTILTNTTSLAAGAYIDLEGNVTPILDLQYTAAGLTTANPACTATTDCIGLFTSPGSTWGTVHYDQIVAAQGVNTTFVANAALTPGTVVGILTAEGHRGVLRVESISPGALITFTYRVYQ